MECGLALGIASSGGSLSAAWATFAAAGSAGTAGTTAASVAAGAGGIGAIGLGLAIGVGSLAIGVAVPLCMLMPGWLAAPPVPQRAQKPHPKITQTVKKLKALKSKPRVGAHVQHKPKTWRRTIRTSQQSDSGTLPVPSPTASPPTSPSPAFAKFLKRVGPSKPLKVQACDMPSIAQAAAWHNTVSTGTGSHTPSLEGVVATPFLQCLGQGRFGRVYLAKLVGGQQCAVKVISSTPAAKGEVQCMLALGSHPGVVQLFHHFIRGLEVHLILEYCDLGSLGGKFFAGSSLRSLTKQLVTALRYIHSCDFIHRDIKHDNIMLCSGGPLNVTLKVADFGCATRIGCCAVSAGTRNFMAPELLLLCEAPCFKADMWSSGVLLHSIVTGVAPTSCSELVETGLSPIPELLPKILKEGHQFSEFLAGLLMEDRSERMSSSQASCHPYISCLA